MRARYYISFDNSTWSEFWPSNSPIISYQKEGQEIFMRPKVDKFIIGRTKNQTIYDDIYSRFFDYTYFGTDIYYKVNVLGTDKFYFIQPVNYGKINTQNSVFECTPDPDDEYRDILLQYDRKWEMRGLNSELFGATNYFYYPKKVTGAFVNINFTTWTEATAGTVSWTSDGSGVMTARNAIPIATDNGDYITITIQNFPGGLVTARLVNGGGTARSAAVNIDSDGQYVMTQNADDTVFVEIKYTPLVASNGSFTYSIFYPVIAASGDTVENILDYCINGSLLVPHMGLSYDIISTYLWNDDLPTGSATDTPNIDTYIKANPTNDYVIEGTQNWNLLWMAKTDVLTTDKEEVTEVSLKEIMSILRDKLRAYWFIDPDGKFRIEHEKYFRDFAVQADLTSATYTGDKPETDVKIYTYDSSNLANQVNYKENNEDTIGFSAYPVTFDPRQTSSLVRDVSVNVSTDVEYISGNPSDASNSGLLLMRCIAMGAKTYCTIDDMTLSPGYGECHPNAHLAWDYLCKYYFTYFADALTGYINYALVLTTFDHVKEFLKQPKVKFRLSSDFDWKKPFTASLGTAWHDTVTYDPESGFYTADLCYNPYAL